MSIVFSYYVHDTWCFASSKLKVYSNGMVICKYQNLQKAYKISQNTISEIYGIVNKFSEVMKEKSIESLIVLDGCYNYFTFSNGTDTNDITAHGISYYREETECTFAKKVLSAFDEIAEVLIKKGVDKSYFKLDISFDDDIE